MMTRNKTIITKNNPIIKVIAVGNDLYGDDGIGSAVLNALANIPNLENVELFDGATDALGLIDHFNGIDHAVIIDAAQMGEKPGKKKSIR